MRKTRPEVAERRIESFEKRFGKAHLYLAYHAAFPLALTPDLLYRLWANFQRDISGEVLGIPWIAVADLLLSRLCDEVGHELYEMDLAVRNELLNRFKEDEKFSQQRINELSDFILDYIRQQLNSDDPDIRDFAQAQKWTALAYTQPRKAARELALALSTAAQNDRDDLLRLASLVETLAEPLSEFEEFQPLLIYARGMASFVRGNQEDVEAYIKLESAVVVGVWRDKVRQAALGMVKLWKIPIVLTALGAIVVFIEFIHPFIRPLYYSYQGNRLLDIRQPEKSLEQFGNMIAINPYSAAAWKGRADAYLSIGRDLQALESYNKSLFFEPNDPKTLNNKGKTLYKLRRYQEALEVHENVLEINPNNPEAWSGKALAYIGLNKYNEASDSLEKLKQINLGEPSTWQQIGLVTELLQGPQAAKSSYEEAVLSYDDLLRTKPNDVVALTERGSVLLKLRRLPEALASYEKALKIDNNFYEALVGKGNALGGLGKPKEALLAFNRATEIRPLDYQVWFSRGSLLAQYMKDYDEALKSFEKAIERRYDLYDAWVNKGTVLLELNRYDEALVAFDKAKDLEPKDPYIWANRGYALEKLGRTQEARNSNNKAVEFGLPREELNMTK